MCLTRLRGRVFVLIAVAFLALLLTRSPAPSAPQQATSPKAAAPVPVPPLPTIAEGVDLFEPSKDTDEEKGAVPPQPAAPPRQPVPVEVVPQPEADGDDELEHLRKAESDLQLIIKNMAPIRPVPPGALPDNPPPHEGAMISEAYLIEPPDLVQVEVIESLPGRPITGERLVRPDGTISLEFLGDVEVRGLTRRQAKEKIVLYLRHRLSDESLGLLIPGEDGKVIAVAPAETDRVFVDLTAYNSKFFVVQGDVAAPGRLPFTGNETVLDAINYAGGLAPTFDPNNIVLARPARGGKSAKYYKIDYKAIVDRADASANLQIFPGDRLVVGRHPTVETTVAIDRMAAPFNTIVQSILTYAFAVRTLGTAGGDNHTLTPAQREAAMRKWADFWLKALARPNRDAMDDKTFRDALIRELVPPADPASPK